MGLHMATQLMLTILTSADTSRIVAGVMGPTPKHGEPRCTATELADPRIT